MSIISLIAAVDEDWGLGKENKLLCHLPADLKHFKEVTMGKPVIMGRKTYNSIGRPLPGRHNIILSRHSTPIKEVTVVKNLKQAIECEKNAEEIMIIGGAQVFKEALPLAQRIYLTRIHHQFTADVFFPHLNPSQWSCQQATFRPQDEKNAYDMTFYFYVRA